MRFLIILLIASLMFLVFPSEEIFAGKCDKIYENCMNGWVGSIPVIGQGLCLFAEIWCHAFVE